VSSNAAIAPAPRLGELLRHWRGRRRMSQLDLASRSGVSSRHLSFVETGRSRPSREMVVHLAEQLDVPLRERNRFLVAAGYAPVYPESSFDSPGLDLPRAAIDMMLANHDPMPALVVDRSWNLVAANKGMSVFLEWIPAELLRPPMNVIRASVHPDGISTRIVNFEEYALDVVERLRRQVAASGDPELAALLDEVMAYPNFAELGSPAPDVPNVVLPMRIRTDGGTILSFFSTMTVFGAPLDVTLSELAMESFFPADAATDVAVRAMVERAAV
jgi:transcriptional regulator with XRE-family HTH domain